MNAYNVGALLDEPNATLMDDVHDVSVIADIGCHTQGYTAQSGLHGFVRTASGSCQLGFA